GFLRTGNDSAQDNVFVQRFIRWRAERRRAVDVFEGAWMTDQGFSRFSKPLRRLTLRGARISSKSFHRFMNAF
ncbi:MAG: hypothetical protein V1761_02705, partial [bacterium]